MPQEYGGKKLQRMMLRTSDGKIYRFKINPTNYQITYGQRTATYKTRTQAVIEDYGTDLPLIQFSGTTGLRKDSEGKTGADRLFELRDFIRNYAVSGHAEGGSNKELYFYNFTDDESFVVHLSQEGLNISRDATQPLLYTYTISLIVIREAGKPSDNEVITPSTGNPFGPGSNGTATGNLDGNKPSRNPNSSSDQYHGALEDVKEDLGIDEDKNKDKDKENTTSENTSFGGQVGTRPSNNTGMGAIATGGSNQWVTQLHLYVL